MRRGGRRGGAARIVRAGRRWLLRHRLRSPVSAPERRLCRQYLPPPGRRRNGVDPGVEAAVLHLPADGVPFAGAPAAGAAAAARAAARAALDRAAAAPAAADRVVVGCWWCRAGPLRGPDVVRIRARGIALARGPVGFT